MSDYAPPPELDLPVGVYQAEIVKKIEAKGIHLDNPETIVLFRLTGPDTKQLKTEVGLENAGLGGRIARAWFELEHPNPVTAGVSKSSMRQLFDAAEVESFDKAIGKIIFIRIAKVRMRSDPSRLKSAAVEFFPLCDLKTQAYVG